MNPISPAVPRRPVAARTTTRWLVVAMTWLVANPATRGDDQPAPESAAGPVANLADGGFLPGTLTDSARSGTMSWQSPLFVTPFELNLDEVQSIRWPGAARPPMAVGGFGFELSGGDMLFGSVVALDDKAAELDVAMLGRVRIDRSRIQRIFRWHDGADLVYYGPNGLTGWREVAPPKGPRKAADPAAPQVAVAFGFNGANAAPAEKPRPPAAAPGPAWVEEGGQLRSIRDGTGLQADIGLPTRARVEIDLSWKQTPNFSIALGVGDDEKSARQAFRFEVWDGQLVVLRETDQEADLAAIRPIAAGAGRARLQVLLDQERGKLLVCSENGETLGTLMLGAKPGPTGTGIRLTNIRGDLCLERLRVVRWDGELTQPIRADESHAQLTDQSIVRGTLDRFDAAVGEFVFGVENGPNRIALDRVQTINLPHVADEARRPVRLIYQDGTRIGGEWGGIEGGRLLLTAPGMTGLLKLPTEKLSAVEVLPVEKKPRQKDEFTGTLEVDGIRTLGRLVNTPGTVGEGCLAWQPLASATASVLRPGTSGRILFQSTAPAQPTTPAARARVQKAVILNAKPTGTRSPAGANLATGQRSLYLRSGDIVPVEVTKIDENGLWFESKLSDNHFVANARIKAVELAPDDHAAPQISKAKRDRLFTLPRMQKDSPPTHLLRSKSGDFLRGRVLGMDDKTVRLEIRLAEKDLPRDRISKIIWLHPDETDPSKKVAPPADEARTNRVQAVRTDGNRLTFTAEGITDGVLVGKSDILGACKVPVRDLDQLLIGASVEKEAVQVAYQNYKLQNAPEPKSAQDDPGSPGGGAAGTESALVGKPAPDFELDLLGGDKFHLADHKGKVIVLDFWATWCGPCLQAMPQIERVTGEFADRGVELVAVNLQETPKQISAMLERQKLSPRVALDKTGIVAEKYAANAIPQTVVIDRDGKVTRLFIGGGPHLGDQLRDVLQGLMPAEKP